MSQPIEYTPTEHRVLWSVAVFGFLGVNGAFLYGALAEPQLLIDAMRNPVSLAFLLEAAILLGLLAYLLTRWGVSRLHWAWFLVLSLVGSMAFALPIVLLWKRPRASGTTSEA